MTRQEIELILNRTARKAGADFQMWVDAATVAALCEFWLSAQDAPTAYVRRVFDCEADAYMGEIGESLPLELAGTRVRIVPIEESRDE